mgnify:CR=1 FL=1
MSRQAESTLPALLGIDGQVRVQVRLVPDSNTGEDPSAQGNNTLTSADVMTVNKVLTMELSPNRVEENSGSRIALRVNRSGRWTTEEIFTLTATGDSRIMVPASITIPANQSGAIIYMSIADNELLDDNETIDAFYELSRMEGIIPALESSHAVAYALKLAKEVGKGSILINLSGRGDKDMDYVIEKYGIR